MGKDEKMNDDLRKLNEKETDEVSGGVLGFGEDHEDGRERSCMLTYHHANECGESPDGYHFWYKDERNCNIVTCKYCRQIATANTSAN